MLIINTRFPHRNGKIHIEIVSKFDHDPSMKKQLSFPAFQGLKGAAESVQKNREKDELQTRYVRLCFREKLSKKNQTK